MSETDQTSPDKELTTADKAVAKTVGDFNHLAVYLQAAGVTPEQLEAAKAEAEKDIRGKYLELERQDPVSVLEKALNDAAETEDERLYLQYQLSVLNHLRRDADRFQYLRKYDYSRVGRSSMWARDANDEMVSYAVVTLLPGQALVDPQTHKSYNFSDSSRKIFLNAVIGGGITLDDLSPANLRVYDEEQIDRNNRSWSEPRLKKPFILKNRQGKYITHIPTIIEGVELQISTNPQNPSVDALFTVEALKKVRANSN